MRRGTRQGVGWDGFDVVTGWRRWLCWCSRAGATAAVKRRLRRRLRRDGKRELTGED
jgi:hypothetical protein